MQITLYSTGCPKCNVLTTKLDSKQIDYTIISDINIISSKGITTVPVLEVDGDMLDFKTAINWINKKEWVGIWDLILG